MPPTGDPIHCTWCGNPGEHLACQAARLFAWAESTEQYAGRLEDPDLANVYWGKAMGLRQAAAMMLAAAPVEPTDLVP